MPHPGSESFGVCPDPFALARDGGPGDRDDADEAIQAREVTGICGKQRQSLGNRAGPWMPLRVTDGLVGEEGDAAVEGLGVDQAHGLLAACRAEETLACPQYDWEDLQSQLIDQVVLSQRAHELEAGGHDDVPGYLLLQLRDLAQHVASQHRRVVPAGMLEGRGHDVLGDAVEPVCQLTTARWPPRSEPVIAPPA